MSGAPRWVEEYLAIPFVDRGRTAAGCDCFGLVRLVMARRAGIVLADYGFVAARDRTTVNAEIVKAKADRELWHPVPIGHARPFDLVPMTEMVRRQDGSSDLDDCHIGIMVTANHVLHTEMASGPVCVEIAHPSIVHRLHPQGAPLVYRHRNL